MYVANKDSSWKQRNLKSYAPKSKTVKNLNDMHCPFEIYFLECETPCLVPSCALDIVLFFPGWG